MTTIEIEAEVESHPGWCEHNTGLRCDGFHTSIDQFTRATVQDRLDAESINLFEVALVQLDAVEGFTDSLPPHVRLMSSTDSSVGRGARNGMTGLAIGRLTADEARQLAGLLTIAADRLDAYLASDDPMVPVVPS